MALRTPTLVKPWYPSSTGTVTDTTSSPGCRDVRLTPVNRSWMAMSLRPDVPATVTTASSAARTGSESPAGDAVPRFPPTVAALRIWGEPTVRAAWASAGTSDENGVPSSVANVTPAPMVTVPDSASWCQRRSPATWPRAMTSEGRR